MHADGGRCLSRFLAFGIWSLINIFDDEDLETMSDCKQNHMRTESFLGCSVINGSSMEDFSTKSFIGT